MLDVRWTVSDLCVGPVPCSIPAEPVMQRVGLWWTCVLDVRWIGVGDVCWICVWMSSNFAPESATASPDLC